MPQRSWRGGGHGGRTARLGVLVIVFSEISKQHARKPECTFNKNRETAKEVVGGFLSFPPDVNKRASFFFVRKHTVRPRRAGGSAARVELHAAPRRNHGRADLQLCQIHIADHPPAMRRPLWLPAAGSRPSAHRNMVHWYL
eukprot:gene24921-biopygen1411